MTFDSIQLRIQLKYSYEMAFKRICPFDLKLIKAGLTATCKQTFTFDVPFFHGNINIFPFDYAN